MTTATHAETVAQATQLLKLAGLSHKITSVTPLSAERTNRVYRVESTAGVHLLKRYFQHPRDSRDSLGQELAFLRHLEWVRCVTAPIAFAALPAANVALLEFIEGTAPRLDQIDEDAIDQAINFFRESNSALDHHSTFALPLAAEACFSIAGHLERIQQRVDRLGQMFDEDEIDVAAKCFVNDELAPAWQAVRREIYAEWPGPGEYSAPLRAEEHCLSPSDFGFHNVLRESNGRLRFIDFEYAGWDDPAKLICDFANQPDMPLPRALIDRFQQAVIADHHNPAALAHRVAALEPLYQVKWTCICLNDFLETGHSRNQFTTGGVRESQPRRQLQLERARQMLARTTSNLLPQSNH